MSLSMDSDSQLLGLSPQSSFFLHLRALFDYASRKRNESSLYAGINDIQTTFCRSTNITSTQSKGLYLGTFPQKELKTSENKRNYQAPDFTTLVIQSHSGREQSVEEFEDTVVFLWEVKASPNGLAFFGPTRQDSVDVQLFIDHFDQIAAQVECARAQFGEKPIYVFLSVGIWFVLFRFAGDPPSLHWSTRTTDRRRPPKLHLKSFKEFTGFVRIFPAPIMNKECIAFTPEFLRALKSSVENIQQVTGVSVTPHSLFRSDDRINSNEDATEELRKQFFKAAVEERAQLAQKDLKYALGEESDQRSGQYSADDETDIDHQKWPPGRLPARQCPKTSPAITRSQASAMPPQVATDSEPETSPANMSKTSKVPSRTREKRGGNVARSRRRDLEVKGSLKQPVGTR